MAEIWVVFAMGSILWIAGFAMQKERNAEESGDYSLRKKGLWVHLFGVHPARERVYLRPASIQVLALLYVLAGSLSALFLEDNTPQNLLWSLLGLGLAGCGLIWLIIDIASARRER